MRRTLTATAFLIAAMIGRDLASLRSQGSHRSRRRGTSMNSTACLPSCRTGAAGDATISSAPSISSRPAKVRQAASLVEIRIVGVARPQPDRRVGASRQSSPDFCAADGSRPHERHHSFQLSRLRDEPHRRALPLRAQGAAVQQHADHDQHRERVVGSSVSKR